jgi:polysaccharide export outer membrane protein
MQRLTRFAAAMLCFGSASLGCAGAGEYVWFRQLPPETALNNNEYIIGVGDVVNIRVLSHDEMTLHQRVPADGRLALLLIGDVVARGKHPSALKAELEGRLKDYIVSPSVAVNIEEVRPMNLVILGEVARPGAFPMETDFSLAHALAIGGGLTDYASRNSVFVVRTDPKPIRIRFSYQDICRNVDGAGDFQLHRGDIVEVE